MPSVKFHVSIFEYLLDSGFDYGRDPLEVADKFQDAAIEALEDVFEPLGYEVDLSEYEGFEGNTYHRIEVKKEGKLFQEYDDFEEGTPEYDALMKADTIFHNLTRSEEEKVQRAELKELPLLLGELETKDGKLSLESRLKDPILAIRDLANASQSLKEFHEKLSKFVKEFIKKE